MNRKTCLLATAPTILLFFSCVKEEVEYIEIKSFGERGWSMHDTLIFTPFFRDTLAKYNLYYYLRMATTYPYSNFYLFVWEKKAGDTSWNKDTVELILADKHGRWLGVEKGAFVENTIMFRKDFRPRRSRKFIIKVVHGMRDSLVKDVLAFGLKFTKVKE